MTLTAVTNPVVPLNLIFTHQRVICPQSRQSAKYRIVTHNFTNDDLTDENSPSYHTQKLSPPFALSVDLISQPCFSRQGILRAFLRAYCSLSCTCYISPN